MICKSESAGEDDNQSLDSMIAMAYKKGLKNKLTGNTGTLLSDCSGGC